MPPEVQSPRLPAAVLFDLDGTLVDTEGLWWEAECAIAEAYGSQWTPEDQRHCLGGPMERVGTYMQQRFGTADAPTVIGERLLDEMAVLLAERPLVWQAGSRALLVATRERGIPTGLVSATYRRLMDAVALAITEDLGDNPFDVTVAGDEVEAGKPHPEPYLTAAAQLGVDITDCVVIEDSPTGVASGQSSGAWVVAVPHIADVPPAPRRTLRASLLGVMPEDLAAWRSG